MYYNTTHLTADQLREAIESCNRQEIRVRQLYRQYGDMTPSECHRHFTDDPTQAGYAPLTSIRRAIHDLTDKGLLFKTDRKRTGIYGRDEYVWSANLLAVPAPDDPVAASQGVAPTEIGRAHV